MKRIINYQNVDMTDDEFAYFEKLLADFPDGKQQIRDLYDVDDEGHISMIHPQPGRQVSWGLLFFFQNLMINQRLRRMEDAQRAAVAGMTDFVTASVARVYDILKEAK